RTLSFKSPRRSSSGSRSSSFSSFLIGFSLWASQLVSTGPLQDGKLLHQARAQAVSLHVEIVGRLQVQPKALRGAEKARQAQRGIGGDRPIAMDDLVDPP